MTGPLAQRWQTASEAETRAVGRELAALLPPAAVVLLTGDLGAGKTTLTKGIAEGRAATKPEEVSSPTFTLIHEYGNPVTIYHVDLYRLDTEEEVRRIGLDELFDRPALVIVEWGERFPKLFPASTLQVRINLVDDTDMRVIELGSMP